MSVWWLFMFKYFILRNFRVEVESSDLCPELALTHWYRHRPCYSRKQSNISHCRYRQRRGKCYFLAHNCYFLYGWPSSVHDVKFSSGPAAGSRVLELHSSTYNHRIFTHNLYQWCLDNTQTSYLAIECVPNMRLETPSSSEQTANHGSHQIWGLIQRFTM